MSIAARLSELISLKVTEMYLLSLTSDRKEIGKCQKEYQRMVSSIERAKVVAKEGYDESIIKLLKQIAAEATRESGLKKSSDPKLNKMIQRDWRKTSQAVSELLMSAWNAQHKK